MSDEEKIDFSAPGALAEFLENHVPHGNGASVVMNNLRLLVNERSLGNPFSWQSFQTALAKTGRFTVCRGSKKSDQPGQGRCLKVVRG